MEQLLELGLNLEQIGKRFAKDPSTVAYWMRKHGLEAVGREKHAANGGIERLEELVEAGMTIAEIAGEVGRSRGTVRHWLRRYGLRTKNSTGARRDGAALAAKQAGLLSVTMVCKHHGETDFVVEGRGYFRCKRCRAERVTRRRRKVKAILVAEAGGRCCLCGYDRYLGALEFHHLDPSEKRIGVSYKGAALARSTLRAEAQKCVLLCSNCHAEVEGGVALLPLE